MPDVVRGVLWMVGQAISFSTMVACVRYLSADIHAAEIVFFRSFFGLLLQAPWLLGGGWRLLAPPVMRMIVLRSFLLYAGSFVWFIGIGMMAISDAVALQFTLPLFAVIGAGLFLRESVGPRRAVATLAGFAGALIIIRPGFQEVSLGSLVVLASAALYASVHLMTKPLSRTVSGSVMIFYGNLICLPLAFAFAARDWVMPAPSHWPYLVAIGLFGTVAHVFMTRAYRLADASMIAPVDFTKMLFTALYGWVLFKEASDALTWVGAAIIFTSTTTITRHESRRAKRDDA